MSSDYKPGEKVELVILKETDLGFIAKINGADKGLLYHDEVFKMLKTGQELPGYIKRVRTDGNIDLLLEPTGHLGAEELGNKILKALNDRDGFIPVNAKSPAEEIYTLFGVSRNKFKIALGRLYKNRLVTFTDKGTELINPIKP